MKQIFKNRIEGSENFDQTKYKRSQKRTLLKSNGILPEGSLYGRVISQAGKTFTVMEFDPIKKISTNLETNCRVAGTAISSEEGAQVVSVGDWVWFISGDGLGSILKIEKRVTALSRKNIITGGEDILAANCDKLLIIMSLDNPRFNPRLIDRFLVAAEAGELETGICINKTDLAEDEDYESLFDIYKNMGIPVFFTSALNKTGLDSMFEFIHNNEIVLAGPSGSGKSTLLNWLVGEKIMQVQSVSLSTSKGRHTTSYSRMFPLITGGWIIDTPGIRELGIWNISREEISLYFHEFDDYYEHCRFMPCTHTHEPDCRVIKALEENEIDFGRYESYINIFESL